MVNLKFVAMAVLSAASALAADKAVYAHFMVSTHMIHGLMSVVVDSAGRYC